MIGIILAVLAAISKGFEKVINRLILIKEDSLSYAFIWQLLSSIFFLPLFIKDFKIPEQGSAWILVIISSVLWSLVAYTGFKAHSKLEVSIKPIISKSKLLFVLLLSIIFLKETLTIEKIIGTTLIFTGIVILTYKKGRKFHSLREKGVQLTILSAFLTASVLIIDKYSTNYFNAGTYSFLVYFIPAIILTPFIINKKQELKSILKNNYKTTITAVLLGAANYYLMLKAFKLEDASIVVPIIELSTLIAVFGGIKYLKEKKEISKKIIAATIVIIGAIIISGIISL